MNQHLFLIRNANLQNFNLVRLNYLSILFPLILNCLQIYDFLSVHSTYHPYPDMIYPKTRSENATIRSKHSLCQQALDLPEAACY